jgi:hypothetical protein
VANPAGRISPDASGHATRISSKRGPRPSGACRVGRNQRVCARAQVARAHDLRACIDRSGINVHDKWICVIEADVPRTNNSATIGSIRIVKRAPDPSS